MTSLLPVVAQGTALGTVGDFLRDELTASPECLTCDWIMKIASENPAVLMAVNIVATDSPDREKVAMLQGMAITYRALSAQAEIEALNRMAL